MVEMIDPKIESGIDRLQNRYIAAVDGKRMDRWFDTFADRPDSSYTCISAESVAANLPVALILDDNRGRLADRVFYVDKVWAGTYQDYRTRHFIQRLSCEQLDTDSYWCLTNFSVMFTPEELGDSRVLTCGVYEDEIVMRGPDFRFLKRRAILDTIVLPRYIVYPI